MAYQRTTKAQGFRQRVVPQNEVKQYTDLHKSLEKERKSTVSDYKAAANEQMVEMKRLSALENQADIYELANLRQFSKTLNNTLDTVAKQVIKPITQGQIQDGINTAIKCQQGDQEACEKVKLNDKQELAIQAQVSEQRTKVNETADNIEKEWDEAGFEAELRQKYRLLNLKKQNSNFALGYRRGILMEAATGWDAFRDSILTGSSDDPLADSKVTVDGESYNVSDYYNIPATKTDVKEAIVASLQNAYITRNGAGLSQFMVNKYLTNKVVERTNVFNQNEFNKGQREWANQQVEYYEDQFLNFNFSDLDTESGIESGQIGVQEWLNNGGAIMEAMGIEGSRNAASKAKLIEFLVETLKSDKFNNVDDSEELLTFLEKPLFYLAGISKKNKDGTYELSSLSDLFGKDLDTDALRAEVLESIAKDSANKLRGQRAQLNERLDDAWLKSGGDVTAYKIALSEIYQSEEYFGKHWANAIFKERDSKWELIRPLSVEESQRIMRKLEKEYDVANGGVISIYNVNVQRIDSDVLEQYKADGKLGDPYGGNTDAKKFHESGIKQIKKIAEGIFDKTDIPKDLADLQLAAFHDWLSPKILTLANKHAKVTGASLEDSIRYASRYYEQKLKASNTTHFPNADPPDTTDGDTDTTSLEIGVNGFSEEIYVTEDKGLSSDSMLTANYKDTVIRANDAASNNNGYIFKENYIVKNPAFYTLVDGRPSKIFNALSMIDPLTTHPAVIYNDQLLLHDKNAKPIEWDDQIKAEIEAWETLSADARLALTSNDDTRFNTAIKNEGYISLTDLTQTLITPDGSIPVNESEYAALMIRAGITEKMTYEQFLERPDIVEKVIKRKMYDGLEIISQVTNNNNETIRRLTAYMITGDHENWNLDDGVTNMKNYTLEALNAYASGDKDRLNSLFHNKGLSLSDFSESVPFSRDLIDTSNSVLNVDLTTVTSVEDLEAILEKFNDLDVPERKINIREYTQNDDPSGMGVGPASHQLRRILGLGWERTSNPEYERYIGFKSKLEDKLSVMRVLEKHGNKNVLDHVGEFVIDNFIRANFEDPNKVLQYHFYPAVESIIGKERLKEIKEKADGNEDLILDALKLQPEFSGVDVGNLEASYFTPITQEGINFEKRLDLEIQMLDIIHSGESTVDIEGGGYEAFNQGGADDGHTVLGYSGTFGNHPAHEGKKLTEMTIGEILAIQDSGYNLKKYPNTPAGDAKWQKDGGIHAAGRYQFTRVGLREALKRSGLKETDLFDEENQDKLAMVLLLQIGPDQWTSMKGNEKLLELVDKYKAIK